MVTDRTRAYVNHGRWIADCVRPYCANAEMVTRGQGQMRCSNCHLGQVVQWPADATPISQVLARRPVPQTRNWAPPGHRQAFASGFPEGQTVAELVDENVEHGVH